MLILIVASSHLSDAYRKVDIDSASDRQGVSILQCGDITWVVEDCAPGLASHVAVLPNTEIVGQKLPVDAKMVS